MAKITIGDTSYNANQEETVLDVLLRENIAIDYGCRQGVCQSCMVQSVDNEPPAAAQNGLKDTLKQNKHFLACLCKTEQDLTIALPNQIDSYVAATVTAKQNLNANTVLLVLEYHEPLDFYAGQFVNLKRTDGLVRSYSIANIARQNNQLEFHIRRLPGGRFSEWVFNDLQIGQEIAASKPKGHCFYLPDRKQQGLLLVGTGSGLAPLAGILQDALSQQHTGPIHLFHGSRTSHELYHIDEMRQLTEKYSNFKYTPCISGADVAKGFTPGRANEVAIEAFADLKGWRIFLCGHPEMVNQMKTDAFLKGANMTDIYADPFLLTSE